MREVRLFGRKAAYSVALVDDEDYALVSQYRWNVWEPTGPRSGQGPYAITNVQRSDGTRTSIKMHKLITGWPETDHRNHNGLDNQRSNLRPAGRSEQQRNTRKRRTAASSRFKGVSWENWSGRWKTQIQVEGRNRTLGRFDSELEAARAYDAAAREIFGDFACVNF